MGMPTPEELTEMTEEEHEFEIRIYMSKRDRQFRWRAVARNGKILADSGEGYKRKADLLHALDILWPEEAGSD